MKHRKRRWRLSRIATLTLLAALSGCGRREPAPAPAEPVPPPFVNTVWEVSRSSAATPGSLYAFLSDTTLVLTSPDGISTLGSWHYRDGGLTMIEKGRTYPVDIVAHTADSLAIVIRGPGAPVTATLIPAARPLPR